MSTNKFRALLEVLKVKDNGDLLVRIPAWVADEHVTIPKVALPADLVDTIQATPSANDCTVYLHAHVNLGAETAADLRYAAPWELSKVQITGDTVERLFSREWSQGDIEEATARDMERRITALRADSSQRSERERQMFQELKKKPRRVKNFWRKTNS